MNSELQNQGESKTLLTQNENTQQVSRDNSQFQSSSKLHTKNKEFFLKKWANKNQFIKPHLLQDYQSQLSSNYVFNTNTPRQYNNSSFSTQHNLSHNEISMMDSFRIQQKYLSGAGLTSNYLSTSALQNSIASLTFGREQRFKSEMPLTKDIQFISYPSSLNARSAGIGYDAKNKHLSLALRTLSQHPSPNEYALNQTSAIQTNIGKPFGISWKQYKKVYNPCTLHIKDPDFSSVEPGPGSYNVEPIPLGCEEKGKQVSLKSRHGLKIQAYSNKNPGPGSYDINYNLIDSSKQKILTLGKQQRFHQWFDCEKPGPGQYKLPSPFDKYHPKTNFFYQKEQQL